MYISAASQLAGFTAAKAETNKRCAFEPFSDEAGYEYLPLAGEYFGRLGKEAAGLLSHFGDVATSNSCSKLGRASCPGWNEQWIILGSSSLGLP